jgi:hypothetical protein
MDLTTSATATETITCAYPSCGTVAPLAESIYVDGCGQICRNCDEEIFGPRPDWWDTIEPPF